MAGSIYVTQIRINSWVLCHCVAWTADASGDVTGNSFPIPGGTLYKMSAIPQAGVTNLYDVTLQIAYKVTSAAGTSRTLTFTDALATLGANLLEGVGGQTIDMNPQFCCPAATATPVIANAGDAKSGTLLFFFWRE